jgi:hypothetical protein
MKEEKLVARIFQEPTGLFHHCDDTLDYLDARGRGIRQSEKPVIGHV